MDFFDEITHVDLGSNDATVNRLERIASLRRSTAEAKKLEAEATRLDLETANIHHTEQNEARKLWLPILAPVLTALAVVGGLWVQVYQVNENSRLQRTSSNAAQFTEAVKMAGSDNGLQSIAGATLIDKFLKSEDYKEQARQVEIGVLATSRHIDTFNLFYPRVSSNTNWDNYKDILQVSQGISGIWLGNYNRLLEIRSRKKPDPALWKEVAALDKENDQVLREIDETTSTWVKLLRGGHPVGIKPDLTGVLLSNADLSGIDLTGAIITGTQLEDCILKNADLEGVEQFEGSDWTRTAWWHAKRINSRLLAFLEENWKYTPNETYFEVEQTKNQHDYQAQVARLRAAPWESPSNSGRRPGASSH